MKLKLSAVLLAFAAMLAVPTAASAPSKAIAVLDAEKSWLKARTMRDSNLLQNVLSENYAHVDATGRLHYREDELAASTKTRRQREVRSEQTVDFAGDVAIVRGISTRRAAGKTTRLRYTDVYRWLRNRWQAVAAQETPIH